MVIINWYLIIINIFSFLLFSIDRLYHDFSDNTLLPNWVYNAVTVLGGAAGVNLYFLLFFNRMDRNGSSLEVYKSARDHYSLWRIFALVFLVIQIVLYFVLDDYFSGEAAIFLFRNFRRHRHITIYLIVINLVTIIVFAVDKAKACANKWRIKELYLFLLSFVGGALGGIVAMDMFRHKTRRKSFVIGLRLMLVMQVVLVVFLLIKGIV